MRLPPTRLGERHAAGLRQRVPARHVEAGHRHAHDALHADQVKAQRELGPELGRRDALALHGVEHRLEDAGDRRHRLRQIAPEVGAAGDALLGLQVDQQQRRLGDGAAAGAEHVGHRHRDADCLEGADGQDRGRIGRSSGPILAVRRRPAPNLAILESLTGGAHIVRADRRVAGPWGAPRGPRSKSLEKRGL